MTFLESGNDEHDAVAARLASAPIAWLSTVRRDGSPQSVPVWFTWTDRAVVLFSGAGTAKLTHLRRQPRCTLAPETEDAGNDVVLIDATAQITDDDHPEVIAAVPRFAAKYAAAMPDGFDEWRRTFAVPVVLTPRRIVAWSKPGGALRYVVVNT